MPYLCKKEKGNDKNFHLKKEKNLYHKFSKKFPKNFLTQKKIEFFFKLKFLIFPFSFLQRLGKNIKIYYLGFLKIITAGQYV